MSSKCKIYILITCILLLTIYFLKLKERLSQLFHKSKSKIYRKRTVTIETSENNGKWNNV